MAPLPGRPTWIDLATPDLDAAQEFYSQLFGWGFADQGADFGGYRMITKDGKFVGGAMSSLMGPEGPTDQPQVPTCWTVYLHTPDMNATLAAAAQSGATVMLPAMDVGDAGRMGLVSDPAGAVVGLWQPLQFEGYEFTGQPGSPVWFECLSKNMAASEAFYRNIVGWDVNAMGGEGPRYVTNGEGNQACAGLCDAATFLPEQVPSFWRVYFGVADTDAACQRITELGGQVTDGPIDSPFGRLATVQDPQGAMFQVIQTQGA